MSPSPEELGLVLTLPEGAEEILAARSGDHARLLEAARRLKAASPATFRDLPHPGRGSLPRETIDTILAWAGNLQLGQRVRSLVCFGIGGSSLGPRLLHRALAPPRTEGAVLHVDTVDPEWLANLWARVDPARSHFLFTSKSGSTAETVACYADALGRIAAARLDPADHVTLITGPAGYLRSEGRRLGATTFPVPDGIGGRFSVLSAVGLVPAAAAGIDVEALLSGAREMDEALEAAPLAANPAVQLALLLHEYATEGGRRIVVPFVYSERLALLGDWLTQLLMESLGKSSRGLTVLPARGTADQHSLLQDLSDGYPDKVVVFVAPRRLEIDVALPASLPGEGGPAALAGATLGRLFEACRTGTRTSLLELGRPAFELTVERVDPRSVGQLLILFEWTTALLAELFGVNAFDQPGVERSKRKTRELLVRRA